MNQKKSKLAQENVLQMKNIAYCCKDIISEIQKQKNVNLLFRYVRT